MKCDRCDNEATVHEILLVDGVHQEKHLCESCAQESELVTGGSMPLGKLIGEIAGAQVRVAEKAKSPGCSGCGLRFAEFRQSGLLGCPVCYQNFEDRLSPLLERAHEGASHHVGKVPKRALSASRQSKQDSNILGGADERERRLMLLKKQLSDAVSSEQYERAAKLRDELAALEDSRKQ
jgi:protein arginine kinase activator